jgi:hypothetical protein
MATELKADAGHVLYLYGLTESLSAASADVLGVDQTSAVEPIELEGVVCWISRVSSDEFEKDLNKNMENLDWLARASVGHQRVLSTIQPQAEVLPARFGTVFRNLSSLRKHVRAGLREFQRDFKRLKNADEWGVKVFVVPSAAAKKVPPASRSGRAYLRAKAAVMPRKDSRPQTDRELEEFAKELDRVAEETAAIGKVSSGQRGLTFQRSLLVKRANRPRMESVLRRFSERWADTRKIECTGPWPPYSFVSAKAESAGSP